MSLTLCRFLTSCVIIMVPAMVATSVGASESIKFSSLDERYKNLKGTLDLPKSKKERVPAVIIVHSTAGPDKQYDFHSGALLDAGFATFEVNFQKGIFKSAKDRPDNSKFDSMLFGALEALRENKAIDPKKVAVMGFSLGGHLSYRAAALPNKEMWLDDDDPGFSAHVSFYPGCKHLGRRADLMFHEYTGAPIIVFWGEKDSYGDGVYCPTYLKKVYQKQPDMVVYKSYPGAHHGFDRNSNSWTGKDRAAINGKATLKWNSKAAKDARASSVAFLKTLVLGINTPVTWKKPGSEGVSKKSLEEWVGSNKSFVPQVQMVLPTA